MRGLHVTTTWEDGLCLLVLEGEARLETVRGLGDATDEIEGRGVKRVIVDMTRLAFMDSAATGTLLRLHARLEAEGGKAVLFGLQRVIQRVFDGLGLTELHIAEDEAEARGQLA